MIKFYKCSNEALVIPVCNCFTDPTYLADAKEIVPNSVDAASEKHLPVVTCSGNTITVNVGSVTHPMSEEHSITTVILETQKGGQYQFLSSDAQPVVKFQIADGDKALAAYAYCNLHGLWKTEV
ncbi:desulfoferrodoxin family protein [Anaerosporobacter faecicola]|uniref:desulfoferrodoxin family protein n=1 Tax=Anaerosporobacter faecicola TaxID=2718714 RepID=UPI001439471E|nr:desulfoferrodoxin family protein [Anaerosporobacter faecicola]